MSALSVDFAFKETYSIEDLLAIMRILRGENGCPWDREQTHQSIRNNFIEETYEAVEAIDNSDPVLLEEELGDVLLQVVYHAEMEREAGRFSFEDVADGICQKLIQRHPHIFGDVVAGTTDEVLDNWDEIKKKTKGQTTYTDTLKSVPKVFPSLMRAAKVQKRAAKSGFAYPDGNWAMEAFPARWRNFGRRCGRTTYPLPVRNWATCCFQRPICPGIWMWMRKSASAPPATNSFPGLRGWKS